MQIWASKPRDLPPKEVGDYARRVEALGYDGLTVSEGVHDGALNAWAALEATSGPPWRRPVSCASPRA